MTVAETIDALKLYNQDLNIVLASDEEGNSFSPLTTLSHQSMIFESAWELYYDPDGKDTVVLWPLR